MDGIEAKFRILEACGNGGRRDNRGRAGTGSMMCIHCYFCLSKEIGWIFIVFQIRTSDLSVYRRSNRSHRIWAWIMWRKV